MFNKRPGYSDTTVAAMDSQTFLNSLILIYQADIHSAENVWNL